MKEILDTILDPGGQPEDFAALPPPRLTGPSPCTGTRSTCSTVSTCANVTPVKTTTHRKNTYSQGPRPRRGARGGHGERGQLQHPLELDLLARLHLLLPALYGKLSELTARHDLPYHVVGSDLAGVVLRGHRPRRDRVEARRGGRRPLPVCRAGELRRAQRHHDGPGAAHLGLRDQLRRPGRAGHRQDQSADAQAQAPDLGRKPPPRVW